MDANAILSKLLDSRVAPALSGAVGGGLVAALTSKRGRKALSGALKLGGVAAVGALAYQAYQRYRADHPPSRSTRAADLPPLQVRDQFLPPPSEAAREARLGRSLVLAAISAAKADGTLEAQEVDSLNARMLEFGLSEVERAECREWFAAPADPLRVARLATTEAEAAEIYLTSSLAVDPQHWTGRAYLQALRSELGIDTDLAQQLEQSAHAPVNSEVA